MRLGRDLKEITLEQGTVVYESGDLIENIYFPLSGVISLLVVTLDGAAVEAAMIGREGAVGLSSGLGKRNSFTRATTQIGGKFLKIRASQLQAIAVASTTLRDLIVGYTEVQLAEAQQIIACNAIHDASARLCRWLLQSADRTNKEFVPLTQELLAQMLGLRRTTVTMLAQSIQERGVIEYRRGRITILDRKGLEACACECYHVICFDRLPAAIGTNL